jgi:tRNA A-37 threonylcarbamoyl transferase component Bud32
MRHRIRIASAAAGLIFLTSATFSTATSVLLAQSFETLQSLEMERFLHEAKIVRLGKTLGGVTMSRQAILELDGVTRFAVFKTIDEKKSGLTELSKGSEINFQDSWRTEIPAYELDKLLGLGMVPTTVARAFDGKEGSLQAWVDLPMCEAERLKKKIRAPEAETWNQQIHKVRMFDNLIYNTDRHANNICISKDWQVILIDHSRAFRSFSTLRAGNDLVRFSRSMLAAMEKLDHATLTAKTSKYLDSYQIEGILKRRDLIVERARRLAKERGEAAVLFP